MRRIFAILVLILLPMVSLASVHLDRASSEYLSSTNSALILAPPFLIMAWTRCVSCTSGGRAIAMMGTASSNVNGHVLLLDGDVAGDPISVTTRQNTGGTEYKASTTTGYAGGAWYHAAGYWAAANDRRVYINGGSKGTNTNTETPATMDTFYLGRKGTTNYFGDDMAEAALYNCTGASAAAVEADIAAAASGDNPVTLHACTLVEYWPLLTNANGACHGINFTENGTITYSSSTHPTVDAFTSCSAGMGGTSLLNLFMMMGR